MNAKRNACLLTDVDSFGLEARTRAAEYVRMAEEECPDGGFLLGDLGLSDDRVLVVERFNLADLPRLPPDAMRHAILHPEFGRSIRWFL